MNLDVKLLQAFGSNFQDLLISQEMCDVVACVFYMMCGDTMAENWEELLGHEGIRAVFALS